MIWVDFIGIVCTIGLITFVLLQSSQDDIQDAFSGEKSELFKNRKTRGFELFLSRATLVLTVLVVLSVFLSNTLPR